MSDKRIYLSPPCVGEEERQSVLKAFDSNYVAPCGPMVDEFEKRIACEANRRHAVALSSGTAALDLAMAEMGGERMEDWCVIVPTLTFIASVAPAWRRGAEICFVDSDWTMNADLALVEEVLSECAKRGKKCAFIGVDLYGRPMEYSSIETMARAYGARYISDSAEALGASLSARKAGSAGEMAIFSFNGNKIITTSGGGALLTDDAAIAARARKRSQQSRENAPWYEHREVGYNYRMSNLLAAVGLAQLEKLEAFKARRGAICTHYREELEGNGWRFAPRREGQNNWLAVAFAPDLATRDAALAALEKANIEARALWKPMHLQSVFSSTRFLGSNVAQEFFERGLCLPTGSGMTQSDVERVIETLKSLGRLDASRPLPGAMAGNAEIVQPSPTPLPLPSEAPGKALILGRGRSGMAAAALLASQGRESIILEGEDEIAEKATGAAFAITSPGVPPDHKWIEECQERGIRVAGELQLGVEALRRRGVKLMAVTGSKGKSSVVKLLAEALGGVPCGNYGLGVSAVGQTPWAVVEVSSFQMETSAFAPGTFEAAAVLNLQEDHLDRHKSIARYHALKLSLLQGAREGCRFDCAVEGEEEKSRLFAGTYFDNPILRRNGAIAVAMLRVAGLDDEAIRRAFAMFKPLAHRMQRLGRFGKLECIDDSKSTSIASLAAALEMVGSKTRLIAGGLEKGDSPNFAISPLTRWAQKVYLIGHSAKMFSLAWGQGVECEICGTLERAVERAFEEAREGETLLFSPGAASYDQFKNFEARGDAFACLVNKQGRKTK